MFSALVHQYHKVLAVSDINVCMDGWDLILCFIH